MNTRNFGRVLSLFVAGVVWVGSVVAAEAPKVVPMGKDTYSITHQAPHTFNRDVDALKASARADAEKFCAEQGKQLKVVNVTAYRPRFISGYANAKIIFKALNPGDPELTSSPSSPVNGVNAGSGDMYSELLKLDDLRQKGILTDEEFAAAKKKVLKRFE